MRSAKPLDRSIEVNCHEYQYAAAAHCASQKPSCCSKTANRPNLWFDATQANVSNEKVELREGVVYAITTSGSSSMADRTRFRDLDWYLCWRLPAAFAAGDNATVRPIRHNRPNPSTIPSELGGQALIGHQGYVEGALELAAEGAWGVVRPKLMAAATARDEQAARRTLRDR